MGCKAKLWGITMAWRLIVPAAAVMLAGLAAPAEAQGVLYRGTLNLPVRAGDRVLEDCRSVIKLDPDDNVLDLAETVCLQPGPQGAGVSLEHYMKTLREAGFKKDGSSGDPADIAPPLYTLCRGKELVMLAYILPSPEKNADGAYIDAVGRPTTLEALRDEAPIGMAYMTEGFCLGY